MKKIVEGYVHVSGFFGVSVFPEYKDTQSISKDIFTSEMRDFEDKKVKIIIEEVKE